MLILFNICESWVDMGFTDSWVAARADSLVFPIMVL